MIRGLGKRVHPHYSCFPPMLKSKKNMTNIENEIVEPCRPTVCSK